MHEIHGGYFDLLGIPIVQGRDLQLGDRRARHAIVVNEAMARRYFEGQNPLGKTIIIRKQSWEIAGVSRDTYLTYLDGIGPQVFEPFSGNAIPTRARAHGSPGRARHRHQHRETNRRQGARAVHSAVSKCRPHACRIAHHVHDLAGIAGSLGAFALLLAVIGMSGVFAYVVQQRTQEIGIRMALGASPNQVIALVLSGTARAAIVGLVIGYAAAAGAAKLLAGIICTE